MWDDLAFFAAVARAGSLAGAAQATGVSQATLSRRMTALEARIGRRLFLRGGSGYALTADGRDLARRTGPMEAAAAEIDAWAGATPGPRPVRISAGIFGAAVLSARLPLYWTPAAPWVPEFVSSDLTMDLARREIDIGLRNRRPDQPWLAGRRIRQVCYATFARHGAITGYIGGSGNRSGNPSVRWVETHHGAEIVTRANDSLLALGLARAGVGRLVMPTFAHLLAPDLVQVGPTIPDLVGEEWLVAHHEGRHDPPVRAAIEAIAADLAEVGRMFAEPSSNGDLSVTDLTRA